MALGRYLSVWRMTQRDLDFALCHQLPVTTVVRSEKMSVFRHPTPLYTGDGVMVNSRA